MSLQGAPNQRTLWAWLEKDLKNQGAQKYMHSKSEVKINKETEETYKN